MDDSRTDTGQPPDLTLPNIKGGSERFGYSTLNPLNAGTALTWPNLKGDIQSFKNNAYFSGVLRGYTFIT